MPRHTTLLAIASILFALATAAIADADETPRVLPPQLHVIELAEAAAPAPTAPAAPTALDADGVVAGMQAYYNSVKVYSAQFEQVAVSKRTRRETRSEGEVWFMKPGRMRWDYATPSEKYMISDGETFWIWEPGYNQYCERDLTQSAMPTALSFLSGTGDLRTDFNAVLVPWDEDGQLRVSLTPKRANGNYQKIDFVVDANSFQVQKAIFEDSLKNASTLSFIDPRVNDENEDVDESQFAFAPPPGANELCQQLP